MEIDRHFDWAYDAKVRKDERGDVTLPKPDRYGTPEYSRMTDAQKKSWLRVGSMIGNKGLGTGRAGGADGQFGYLNWAT